MKIYQVDAFSDAPFRGNPAAVCILSAPVEDAWMRSVAMEMNLSETAFLLPESDGYRLRWFTPAAEVRLCGHATLASAHILRQVGLLAEGETAKFYTLSGLLTAQVKDGGITLDFPAQHAAPANPAPGLLEALGVEQALFVGKNVADFLIELDSEDAVRALKPDFGRLSAIGGVRGVIVTARAAEAGVDFVSRFFAPAVGVNEDPVTGSAHTALTPYWSAKLGKMEMQAFQASARGGTLRVSLRGERVLIEGQAVTVLEGELRA